MADRRAESIPIISPADCDCTIRKHPERLIGRVLHASGARGAYDRPGGRRSLLGPSRRSGKRGARHVIRALLATVSYTLPPRCRAKNCSICR